LALASGLVRWPGIDPVPEIGLCEPSASLAAGVRLQHSVVGASAVLAPGTQLERCVVWPGAHVAGSHHDSVVLSDGRVIHVSAR
jgi:hypothetical protein